MAYVNDYTSLTNGISRWNAADTVGTPVTVAYCFLETNQLPSLSVLPPYEPSKVNSYTSMDTARREAIKATLDEYASACGVKFIEVQNPNVANIQFLSNIGTGSFSWAYLPRSGSGYSSTSRVVLTENPSSQSDANWLPGGWAYTIALHEIGHAMGLDHPHEGTLLSPSLDNHNNTVMSYNWSWSGSIAPDYKSRSTLGPLDVDALTYLYGSGTFSNLGLTTSWNEATETFRLTGTSANNTLIGLRADSVLSAGGGSDKLFGQRGDDILNGGAGADRMVGGAGNDIYHVDNARDVIVERAGQGRDHVNASVSYALRDHTQHVETLTLVGNGNINGTGNARDNIIRGNAGNNKLDGALGNDILNGGAGADRMIGGAGNDIYHVDNARDVIVENAGQGRDHVNAAVSFSLRAQGQHIEVLTLVGGGNINGTGNGKANVIRGNAGNNILNGAGGNDHLIGGAGNDVFRDDNGADRMVGGTGNDIYYVDNAGDVIIEHAGQGRDHVNASVSYALRDHSQYVETLTLVGNGNINGTGNARDNLIRGNAGNNKLDGALGNDILNGGAGADRMIGGAGNDTFHVDNVRDVIVENAGEGRDHVNASVSYALRDHSQHIETLTLVGSGNINGTGNGQANIIRGNAADNILNGALGDDILIGGAGNDTFRDDMGNDQMTGGSGADTFVFLPNFGNDMITDFNTAEAGERIDLSAVSTITDYADLTSSHISQSGEDTVIDDGQGNTITLMGVNMSELAADDFLF